MILHCTDFYDLFFEIKDNQLIYLDTNAAEGPIIVGTIFMFFENEKQELKIGIYKTDDSIASVALLDDNKYIFNRHIGTSYRPTGNYLIENGKLMLFIDAEVEFIFDILDNQLVFVSGYLAESLVEVGTIFMLTD